jgi:predicted RND superfamily exporter protein
MKIEDHIVTQIVIKLEKVKSQINEKKYIEALSEINMLLSNIEKVEKDGSNSKKKIK